MSTHAPFEQVPVQQSLAFVHALPRDSHTLGAHVPFWHVPEQQLLSVVQVLPTNAQSGSTTWHTLSMQNPEQHDVLEQSVQSSAHPCAHLPSEQLSEQQSLSSEHALAIAVQVFGGS